MNERQNLGAGQGAGAPSNERGGPARWQISIADEPEIEGASAQSVSPFQLLIRGDPAGCADVCALSVVVAERGGSAVRARDRYLSQNGAAVVEQVRAAVCR